VVENMSKSATNFLHALIAVVAGNAVYFLLERYLPARAHHSPFRIDLGMVVDFWFCLVVFGIVKMIAARRQQSRSKL
jgi:hypothetical protein